MLDSKDLQALYDDHEDYVERRNPESLSALEIAREAREFKVPNLLRVVPSDLWVTSIIEIGCATGEVLAAFPDRWGDSGEVIRKTGFDISPLNIHAARSRYPDINFLDSDFTTHSAKSDLVVLSDVLEHVPDDVDFLRKASELAPVVLVNLPLEDNWLNRNRNYGVDDVSGHLRAYSLRDGLSLVEAAGLRVLKWRRIWVHETDFDLHRREWRRAHSGAVHTGSPVMRAIKTVTYHSARAIKPFGRRLLSSNLFLSAGKSIPNG